MVLCPFAYEILISLPNPLLVRDRNLLYPVKKNVSSRIISTPIVVKAPDANPKALPTTEVLVEQPLQ